MSTEAKVHARAQLIVDAARAAPLVDINPNWTDAQARREVVRAVLGEHQAHDGRSDEYVEACFQIIKEDGRVAKAPAPRFYGNAHRRDRH